MFCIDCGKQIADDSKFCEFCGNQLSEAEPEVKEKLKEEEEVKEPEPSGKQTYWEKFAELYGSEEKRKHYDALSSDAAWELINRFAGNTFADFMEQNTALHKKPHKDIDAIKNEFIISLGAGYYMWLSEQVYNERELKTPSVGSVEDLAKEWKNSDIAKDYHRYIQNIPTMIVNAMDTFNSWRFKTLSEEITSLGDLPYEMIEKIKTQLSILLLMGYTVGAIEGKFRK